MTETIQRAARAIRPMVVPETDAELAVKRVIETLLDPSEEAVEAATIAYVTEDYGGEDPANRIDDIDRQCIRAAIRAYHMTILGREE